MGKILRHLLEALRSTAVMWSNFGTGAKDVAADLIRLKTKVNERRYLDTFYIWVTLMTHWGGEVEQVCVSHTYHHPTMHLPTQTLPCSTFNSGVKANAKRIAYRSKMKGSSSYDLSLVWLRQPKLPLSSHPLPYFITLRCSFHANPLTHSLILFPSFSTQSLFFYWVTLIVLRKSWLARRAQSTSL